MKNIYNYDQFLKENQFQVGQISNNDFDIENNKIDTKYLSIIEYTYLKPGANKEDINKLIKEAESNNFYAVCVPPDMVDHAVYTISNEKLKVVSTVSFPDGDNTQSEKLLQTTELIVDGVNEIDMVMNYKLLKKAYVEEDSDIQKSTYEQIEQEIRTISNECHKNGVILKVIIESGELTLEQVTKSCELITNAGADYVATCTGTKTKGIEFDKVKEMRRVLPEYIKIKVMGGIRTLQDVEKLYPYIDRIGTSVILK